MTLEQIRNRQYTINDALHTLLLNTEGVINTILGDQAVAEDIKESLSPYGLLQEITVAQDATEGFIRSLEHYNKLLIDNTYSPVVAAVKPK